jgi:nucleotide-binding universal stress UspA family protein
VISKKLKENIKAADEKDAGSMKIKRLLVYLFDAADKEIFDSVVKLCHTFESQLFALFVLEEARISQVARMTREKNENIRQRIEEEGWEMLYLVEDEAVESGVRTSLHMEEGSAAGVIKKYVENYDIDAVIIKRRDETRRLFLSSPVPVIGL